MLIQGRFTFSKGTHVFAVYHYASVPSGTFKLNDALGQDNKLRSSVKSNGRKEPRAFTLGYIKPGQTKVTALPADVFSFE